MANRSNLPKDGNGIAFQLTPAKVALGRVVQTPTTSTTRNLTAGTTIIRCYSKTQDSYLKWGSTTVDATNFDEVIPAGQIVDLVVPRDSVGVRFTTIRTLEVTSGATLTIIEK